LFIGHNFLGNAQCFVFAEHGGGASVDNAWEREKTEEIEADNHDIIHLLCEIIRLFNC
jgi:hypothetical protein